MNEKIKHFKESMLASMILNYQRDGYLAPVFFMLLSDGRPAMSLIPRDLLTPENKIQLAFLIKNIIAKNSTVIAAGLIIEAYGAQMHKDSEMTKLVLNGNMEMKDIKDKHDIIIMLFSTPEKEEFFSYLVDEETKTVGEKFVDDDSKNCNGIFSNLFTWNKN